MNHLGLRLLASALTLGFALPSNASHAAPAAVAAPEVRMDHISVVTIGKGTPVILIPGLACPRAVYDALPPISPGRTGSCWCRSTASAATIPARI